MNVSEPVMAAMIGATATVCTAVFQLVVNWRKATTSEKPRARGGLRSLLWMVTLMAAAAVGGFAYAEYRAQATRGEAALLREEVNRQLGALSASTARLETLLAAGGADSAAARRQRGLEGVAAVVALPACRGSQVGFATERSACTERDALQVAVCASVPSDASISAVELFARSEDSQQPWAEARATAGQDLGSGRFATGHSERLDADGTRQVCQSFSHWGDKGRTVRILVRYL